MDFSIPPLITGLPSSRPWRLMTNGTHFDRMLPVKPYRWGKEKNEKLKSERGISFEEIVLAIEEGGLRDVLIHPNQRRYAGQLILVVAYREYAYLVPSVEEDEYYFLKTIIPSRKATRDYLEGRDRDEKA